MEQINYIGENLLPGQIGHGFIILSFVASLLAVIAYFFATQNREKDLTLSSSWNKIGRSAFLVHGISVFGIMAMIFYVMINNMFEYQYAWEHVSEDLPMKYIFSAFWEGQEGSFLLWMFWHVVLGVVVMFTAKKWEAPTMATLAAVQLFLGSMILGLYFGDAEIKIGANPLVLLRDVNDAPIFTRENYLSLIEGNGLNPLLQNYWMTIHPPTLFLGFASTTIPFCFAIAALWTKDYKSWLKPVLNWSLFSAMILGTGILMGGAWAYEALSFGGYWAWDPVENSSLVPWLILIAGIHTAMVAKNTGYSIKSTFLFLMLTFIFIVYSTFLTRSGILGDTSVHAFTEMGLEWQLIGFLGFFTLLGIGLLAARWRQIPAPKNEESAYSREFWMFIGSLVLIFSAVLITFTTSIPVYNKIALFFDPTFEELSPPKEVVPHYNKYQLWIALLIGVLSGVAQFMRYKAAGSKKALRNSGIHLGVTALIAAGLTVALAFTFSSLSWQHLLLLWSGLFAITSNLDYVITVLRGKIAISASAVSHIGFGIMILGILYSGLNKNVISRGFMEVGMIEGFDEDDRGNNILLYKDLPTRMDDYLVTYTSDSVDGFNRYFNIEYQKMNKEGKVTEEFTLKPNIIYDKNENKIAASNPSTKHYLHKDIFTHVSALPRSEMEPEIAKALEDSLKYIQYDINLNDTIFLSKKYAVTFEGFTKTPYNDHYKPEDGDGKLGANLKVFIANTDTSWMLTPMVLTRDDQQFVLHDQVSEIGVKAKIADDFFKIEENLNYQKYKLKIGESTKVGDVSITFNGFQREINNKDYERIEGDIAVSAVLEAVLNEERQIAEPVYLIRGQEQFNVADEIRDFGLKFRFFNVNPETEEVTLFIADNFPKKEKVVVEIAENVVRNDYVVMEAIVFPGINLFWLGSVMMMIGFGMGMWQRLRKG